MVGLRFWSHICIQVSEGLTRDSPMSSTTAFVFTVGHVMFGGLDPKNGSPTPSLLRPGPSVLFLFCALRKSAQEARTAPHRQTAEPPPAGAPGQRLLSQIETEAKLRRAVTLRSPGPRGPRKSGAGAKRADRIPRSARESGCRRREVALK